MIRSSCLFGVACENIRFSSLFAARDVSRETSPAAKSEEKRIFSPAMFGVESYFGQREKGCLASFSIKDL